MHDADWWTKDNKPHPSKRTIAEALGVDPRTVQRRIAAMEKAGFIHREQRRMRGKGSKTNHYSLDGLIREAQPYAKEKLEERARREEEDKAFPLLITGSLTRASSGGCSPSHKARV